MTKKDRIIANQNAMIDNRDKKIYELKLKNEYLEKENLNVRQLRQEKEEMETILNNILKLTTINTYNNEKAILRKVKELVSDYQSTKLTQ